MANRYWVGGNGTWDAVSTANWSATTGGASGASAPTSSDAVIIDSASGSGVCTTASGAACASVTLNSSVTSLTLGSNLSMSGNFVHTAGTLTLSSSTLSCFNFNSSNSNTRTIAFDTGNITVTGNASTVFSVSTATNLTVTGTAVVNSTYSGSTGTRTIFPGASILEAQNISFNISAGTDIVTIGGSNQGAKNIDFTGFAGTLTNSARYIFGNIIISTGMTVSAGTGLTILAATSGTQQITTNGKTLDFPITQNGVGGTVQLQDNLTMGSTRTFTLTNGALDLNNQTLSTGLFVSTNANVRSIAFGTGNIELTGNAATVWNFSNLINFSYTGTPTVNSTYSGGTGTRTIAHGNAAGGTEFTAISMNVTAGTDIVAAYQHFKNLNFTGFSGTRSNFGNFIYGNLTISPTMTVAGGNLSFQFGGTSGVQQITTNGVALNLPLFFTGIGGTYTFQDALTLASTRALTLADGALNLKSGVTSTVGSFVTTGTTQKYLGSSTPGIQATLSDASGTNTVSYLTIQDINATGGAVWYSPVTQLNVDAGNNDGWDFFVQLGQYMYTRRKNKRLLIS